MAKDSEKFSPGTAPMAARRGKASGSRPTLPCQPHASVAPLCVAPSCLKRLQSHRAQCRHCQVLSSWPRSIVHSQCARKGDGVALGAASVRRPGGMASCSIPSFLESHSFSQAGPAAAAISLQGLDMTVHPALDPHLRTISRSPDLPGSYRPSTTSKKQINPQALAKLWL